MTDEIKQGFEMMKFSNNHPWLFESWVSAFCVGLLQASVVISVEVVNLAVLNTNNTILDILMNFLALVIIADFDDMFFATVASDPMAKLISNGELEMEEDGRTNENGNPIKLEDILKRKVTTSKEARHMIRSNRTLHFNEDEGSYE